MPFSTGESKEQGAVGGVRRCGVSRAGLAEYVYPVADTAHRMEFASAHIPAWGLQLMVDTLDWIMRHDPQSAAPSEPGRPPLTLLK